MLMKFGPNSKKAQKAFQQFLDWQKSYRSEIHGVLDLNEWLDLHSFESGGVNGHTSPTCESCLSLTESEKGLW